MSILPMEYNTCCVGLQANGGEIGVSEVFGLCYNEKNGWRLGEGPQKYE